MKKITPFLWFDNKAEEAANFYVAVFGQNSKITSANQMMAVFELQGQTFYALNGGPQYKFTEAISLFVDCDTQEEVDMFWEKLSAGGEKGKCGWLKDKYGLSWQIIPKQLSQMLQDKDPARAGRVMQAMLKMTKIDIAKLQKAYDQK